MRPFRAVPSGPLRGTVTLPGDKSISHRALILGLLAVGRTRISNLLESGDVFSTVAAIRALGATVEKGADGVWTVDGAGTGGLTEPGDILDMGNSGTSARLLMGVLAAHDMTAFMTGDASLRGRPMNRVAAPLRRMGAQIHCRTGGRLPAMVSGARDVLAIEYTLETPSAQVKSAVLLAGLNAFGETTVVEPVATRDHTERMLARFGATVETRDLPGGGRRITLAGQPELTGCGLAVPADPSAAAFPAVAAAILPGGRVTVPNMCINPTRAGLYDRLAEMGVDIHYTNRRLEGGEPVADITIAANRLRGIDVPPDQAPMMIDEYPILAVAAACAEGRTVMRGIGELRVKESDRLAAVAEGLRANGIRVQETEDSLTVEGTGGAVPGGGLVRTRLDHRIAMSFLVLGMAARQGVTVDDIEPVATSFPGFPALMRELGAVLEPAGDTGSDPAAG